MKLPALLVTDLHLVSGTACAYRWDLFPWLAEQIKAERVRTLVILGDLTDAKDNHSAELVNRIVQEVKALAALGITIKILAGNHDWLRMGHEFFKFLGVIPGVEFIAKPTEDDDYTGPLSFFLPYSKNPAKEWAERDFSHYDYLFMHQTVKGARSSNGQEMSGEALPPLNAGKVYSGDIHVPQVVRTEIGEVEYVGSPYHVHMGDDFVPRCVLIERSRKAVDLHFKTIRRITLAVPGLAALRDGGKVRRGDHVKLRLELDAADKHDWARVKREATAWLEERGAVNCGVELVVRGAEVRLAAGAARERIHPAEAVLRFVESEQLGGSVLDAALEIIESAR